MRLGDEIVSGVPFYWREVFVSQRHPDLARELPALITAVQKQNAIWLIKVLLQPAREFADFPFAVESWFRSDALNVAVGGSKASMHMEASAVDLVMEAKQLERMYYWWMNSCRHCFGQLRYYPNKGFIHISLPGATKRGEYKIIR